MQTRRKRKPNSAVRPERLSDRLEGPLPGLLLFLTQDRRETRLRCIIKESTVNQGFYSSTSPNSTSETDLL